VISEPGVFVIKEAHFLLTAADGSIAGIGDGHASHPSVRAHVYAWGMFHILKGTGAYRRATGGGLFAADADLMASTAKLYLSGTLT
jgi:hypothetical protein